MVSFAETQFSAPAPFRDPINSTTAPSSHIISLWTNPGGHKAKSCCDVQKCHQREDIWNRFQTHQLIASGKCKSHPRGSEHQYWRARKPMEHPPCVLWYLNIDSKTIKERQTITLFMEFWDFGWVSSGRDKKQCELAHCDECENWIETASQCNVEISFTLWLVFSDNVADFRCAWRCSGWGCDGKARRQGTVFRSAEFDACNPDWRPGRSTGCGSPDDPDCTALDNKEEGRIETRQWESTNSDTEGECTPGWSQMAWGRAS